MTAVVCVCGLEAAANQRPGETHVVRTDIYCPKHDGKIAPMTDPSNVLPVAAAEAVVSLRRVLQFELQPMVSLCKCGHQVNQHNYGTQACAASPPHHCEAFEWDGTVHPALAAFERAVAAAALVDETCTRCGHVHDAWQAICDRILIDENGKVSGCACETFVPRAEPAVVDDAK